MPIEESRSGAPIEDVQPDTGRFDLGPFPPGEWSLWVLLPNGPEQVLGPKRLGPNEIWDLGPTLVQLPGTLLVRFERDEGVASDPQLKLRVTQQGKSRACEFDCDGESARSKPLAPGEYEVRSSGSTAASDQVRFTIRPGERSELALRLRSGVVRNLRVVDAALDPAVRLAALVVRASDGRLVHNARVWVGDASPVAALTLPIGSYSLVATSGTGKRAEASLVVANLKPQEETVTLTLR